LREARQLPIDRVGGIEMGRTLSWGWVLALCFLTGLIMKTRVGISVRAFVEGTILMRVPGYCVMNWGLGSHQLLTGEDETDRSKAGLR
jgi:hypothetical protein